MIWVDRLFKRDKAVAPSKSQGQRLYAGAKGGRLMFSASSGSANNELYTSLPVLRNRARALVRDVVYAKRAKSIIVDNVIGKGMGMQSQVTNRRGRLMKEVNDPIEAAWADWCLADTAHTGGVLHFSDLERAAMGEVFESGEVFIRIHRTPFGRGSIPLCLELIEAERIADDYEIKVPNGARVTMGIEHDRYGRPLAYYVHTIHPNDLRLAPGRLEDQIERIPAADMFHLKITDRWPQTRGVPWLHAAISRLNQLGEFEEAAVVAARIGASKVGFFENPEGYTEDLGDGQENGTPTATVEAGEFTQLPPGYKFNSWDPNYPNEVFDPFTRAILRGVSAGIPGTHYSALSQDYSQANYSSERSSILDTRATWQVLQQWWIRVFRQPLHRKWLSAAMLSKSIPGLDLLAYAADLRKYEAVKFKPRGWSWVDPTKEVAAYKEAEKAGYITKGQIISATNNGQDIEDVVLDRRRELDLLAEQDIETDTTDFMAEPAHAQATPASHQNDTPDDPSADDTQPARLYAIKRDYP